MLATPDLPPDMAALAYSMRALAYSVKGQYDKALPDYDRALAINPNFAAALNNRAWALFKSGRAESGKDTSSDRWRCNRVVRTLSILELNPADARQGRRRDGRL